ncbi:hypothetical protein Tco_0581980 [Tanacetum coccineum]
MEEIIVKRDDNKPYSFSEADFKYLNKNDIEDIYYLCLNGKVNYQYQIKVNLTAPTLTIHGIDELNRYSIIDVPFVRIIYENNKKERRIMGLSEIPKLCDTTLDKVLKEVKLKIVESRYKLKTPLLSDLDFKIMETKGSAIKGSKKLSSLALDELIGNLKVHEAVMEKDSEIYRIKKERVKSIALKAKKESSDDETSTSGSNQEKKRSHSDKGMRRKERVIGNALDAVIQIISLAIVQNHLATKIKRPSWEVLRAIAKITSRTKLTMKLVSWLNSQMR